MPRSRYFADEDKVREVWLRALRVVSFAGFASFVLLRD